MSIMSIMSIINTSARPARAVCLSGLIVGTDPRG